MIHYAAVSALISIFLMVVVPGVIVVIFYLRTPAAQGGEEALSDTLGGAVVYSLAALAVGVLLIVNYAWGGWW